MRVFLRLPWPDGVDGNEIAEAAFDKIKTAYGEAFGATGAVLETPENCLTVDLTHGKTDPDAIRDLIENWNDWVRDEFESKLNTLLFLVDYGPEKRTNLKWAGHPHRLLSVARAAESLAGEPGPFADRLLILGLDGENNNIQVLMDEDETNEVLENIRDYAAITVYPKKYPEMTTERK